MTTPTREQVIEWAKEAGLLNRAVFNHETELYRLCNLAFDAGREQGLREAAAFVGPDLQTGEGESLAAALAKGGEHG